MLWHLYIVGAVDGRKAKTDRNIRGICGMLNFLSEKLIF